MPIPELVRHDGLLIPLVRCLGQQAGTPAAAAVTAVTGTRQTIDIVGEIVDRVAELAPHRV